MKGAPSSPQSVKSIDSEVSGYVASEIESDDDTHREDEAFEPSPPIIRKSLPTESSSLAPIHNSGPRLVQLCGLCGRMHGDGPGECMMTEKSENLAEFREMLMLHAEDEPWEQRVCLL